MWIWNNSFVNCSDDWDDTTPMYITDDNSGAVLNTDWFNGVQKTYTPYPYPHPLTLDDSTSYSVTFASDSHSSTNPSEGEYNYENGTQLNLTATIDTGYSFLNWVISGIGNSTINPLPLTINSTLDGKTITSYTEMLNYTFTIASGDNGATNYTGTHSLQEGTSIYIQATPNDNYVFNNWTSTLGTFTTNPLSLTVNSSIDDVTFTANFILNTYTAVLTITNPTATTYQTSSIPVELSSSGNDTNRVITWNAQFSNGTWVYGSNQTYTTTTIMTINSNASNILFCAIVIGDNGAKDYKTVTFSVAIPPTIYTATLTIVNPQATTYTSSSIPVELSSSGNDTNRVITWNAQFSNGTWQYLSNQTYSTTTTMTIPINASNILFCAIVIGDNGAKDYKTVTFSVAIPATNYPVTITIISPTNTTYSSNIITVSFSASTNGTLQTRWWNIKNSTNWIYESNQTYTTATQAIGITNGTSYTFYAWANNTAGFSDVKTVAFSVVLRDWYAFTSLTFKDLADADVTTTWLLYNSTTLLSYTPGQYTLNGGIYTLKTYYAGNLLNTTNFNTATYGNGSLTVNLQLRLGTIYGIGFNSSVTNLVINSENSTHISFTATGSSGPYQIVVPSTLNASYVSKDGTNQTYNSVWIFDPTNNAIIISTASLSDWDIDFTQEGVAIPPIITILAFSLYNSLGFLAIIPVVLGAVLLFSGIVIFKKIGENGEGEIDPKLAVAFVVASVLVEIGVTIAIVTVHAISGV